LLPEHLAANGKMIGHPVAAVEFVVKPPHAPRLIGFAARFVRPGRILRRLGLQFGLDQLGVRGRKNEYSPAILLHLTQAVEGDRLVQIACRVVAARLRTIDLRVLPAS
jgi:hypothetical protein